MRFSPFQTKFTRSAIKTVLLVAASILIHTQIYAAGVLDPTFGTNGRAGATIGSSSQANAIAVQPDGKIVLAGYALNDNSGKDIAVARFNPNGSLDTGFGNGGTVLTTISNRDETAFAVALQPDGKIVVAGNTQPSELSSSDFLLVRYNSDGTLDTGFGAGGIITLNQGSDDFFRAVVVQPDGKIVASGYTSDAGGRATVVRYNQNGTLDGGFADGGLLFFDVPNTGGESFSSLGLYQNGRILIGGQASATGIPSGINNYLVMLEPDGEPAQDFGNQGIVFSLDADVPSISIGFDFVIQPDGKILTTGVSTRRYLSNGALDPNFQIGSVFTNGLYGSHIALRPDGKFVISRLSSEDIVIVEKNGRLIGKTKNNIYGVEVAAQSDNKILVVGLIGFSVTRLQAITSQATKIADYDADDKTDIAVLRPSNSTLYVLRSQAGIAAYNSGEASFEVRRVIPEIDRCNFQTPFVYQRWNGNIEGSLAAFIRTDGAGIRNAVQFGVVGDIPTGGDFDGSGCTDFTVFRPSNGTWYILTNPDNQFRAVRFGQAGDQPVPADYDYDGVTDIAVFRPSNGVWYVLRSSDSQFQAAQFGQNGDIPLTGDFDGDGRGDFTVYRPSNGTWYSLQTSGGFRAAQFGISTDQPVPGDYDGDGRHDIAVFRNGVWYILGSTRGFYAVQWGSPGDTPVAVRYAY